MTARPWMPLYVGDYVANTAHLNAAESGAYLHLIMHYWMNAGLPNDDKMLARIAKMTPAQWKAARPIIELFFSDGWKHKRIEFELTEAARLSAAGKAGGKASGEARRSTKAQRSANDVRTTDERSFNDPLTKPEALHLPSQLQRKNSKNSVANATAAVAAPVYTDSRHELWGEGIAILGQLGVSESAARSNIGRWLKMVNDDCALLLGSIQRARDNRVIDPIPWITQSLNTGNGHEITRRNSDARSGETFSGHALRLARELASETAGDRKRGD